LQRWTAGVIGDPATGGANPPRRPSDEVRFRLDLLPFVERTVQPYGVAIDGIRYYGDVLRRFIGASEDGRKRSFVFRRDPRDISTIYFWDPEVKQYSAIPYRNTTYPPLSVWELRELRRTLSTSGAAPIDEAAIFAAYARLREHEARAVTQTKRARRVRVRRPVSALPADEPAADDAPALLSFAEIVPFVIEELK
jgi:putative transposase